ncbi:MAG TPA: hypothetical protein IAC28_00480 [Candidatus Aphodovivens excrementavium]|nr:hypothetical protein [Candidatus Aphodovivens excrementavium]
MANIGDGFKDIFFAGIGALAITGEKAKEVVDQLIAKGEITVDQGKQLNSELTRKVGEAATNVRYATIEARMKAMSAEERAEFVAKAAEIADNINEKSEKEAEAQAADANEAGGEDPIDVAPEAPASNDGADQGAPDQQASQQ